MTTPRLLAVPNASEGRDHAIVAALAEAFAGHPPTDRDSSVRLLNVHSDADHHRSVFTLAGRQGALAGPIVAGAREAVGCLDVGEGRERADVGQHPHVGALDVAPVVYLEAGARGAACAEALVIGARIGEELGVPVFMYGELARGRTRAQLRSGGVEGLGRRMASGELAPDFGPRALHPTAGATLVAAREPLVAFNLELAPPSGIEQARAIAALIREGGAEGLPGVRAIGVALKARGGSHGREPRAQEDESRAHGGELHAHGGEPRGGDAAQVSTNVERPLEVPLRRVVEAVARHAEVATTELVGLAPKAALEGFPEELPLRDFDPMAHVIENALGF